MKLIFIIFLLIAGVINNFSQDLIVTNEGDSLNCKITKINDDNIYFTFKHKEEIRSTLLPVGQVKEHKNNYFQIAIVPAERIIYSESYSHWRFSINSGWSYNTAKVADNVPSDFKNYVEDLKSGYHYSADVTYFFAEQLGFGFKYLVFNSSNNFDNIYVDKPNQPRKYGKMSDDLSIKFIGPFLCTRILNFTKKNALMMNLGIGYLGYYDKKVLVDNYTMTGNTVGLLCDIGYDIGISKNMAIGIQISYLIGSLNEYNWNDGVSTSTIKLDKDTYESLNRFDISIGLRFNTTK